MDTNDTQGSAPTVAERLAELRDTYAVFRDLKPLKIGIHHDLRERGMPITRAVRQAILAHVREREYLGALVAGGERFDLDGNPAGEITEQQQGEAAKMLAHYRPIPLRLLNSKKKKSIRRAKARGQQSEEIVMHAKLKATLVVTDFDKHLDLDTIGASQVPVRFETESGTVTAVLSAKSFRKAQATFREIAATGEAAVVISGGLNLSARRLEGAGIVVQARKPKEPKAEAPAEAAPAPAPQSPTVTVKKRRTLEP